FSYAMDHVARCMQHIGMGDRWAVRFALREGDCWGLSENAVKELYRSCDALLNVVGATELRDEHLKAPLRVYVECDPVTAELRFASGNPQIMKEFAEHHLFVTYGENYGNPDCGVPLNGFS